MDNQPDLKGSRVLVVEDNLDVQFLLCLFLQSFGADARGVSTVSDALQAVREFSPTVIVSDLGVPGEDGYALIRRIRALPRGEGGMVPALALTGFTADEARAAALRAGFQACECKPIEPEELAARVASLTVRTS